LWLYAHVWRAFENEFDVKGLGVEIKSELQVYVYFIMNGPEATAPLPD
jgi:hypothetical protein